MFYHFDISVFTDGRRRRLARRATSIRTSTTRPKLNTDQWLEAAKHGGRITVFVAKHCTGFISWQSDAYPYGVRQSKWRGRQRRRGRRLRRLVPKIRHPAGPLLQHAGQRLLRRVRQLHGQGPTGPNDPRQIEVSAASGTPGDGTLGQLRPAHLHLVRRRHASTGEKGDRTWCPSSNGSSRTP